MRHAAAVRHGAAGTAAAVRLGAAGTVQAAAAAESVASMAHVDGLVTTRELIVSNAHMVPPARSARTKRACGLLAGGGRRPAVALVPRA